jgi:hypothetical protein
MLTRRLILALGAAALALPAGAEEPYVHVARGAAVAGYDPVGYFTEGRPVRGSMANAVKWRGAIWYFASPASRAAFEADPTAYAPQFGGYCAYAVARGFTADIDPSAWHIRDGKLYLTHSPKVYALWSADMDGNIRQANANWPGVLGD